MEQIVKHYSPAIIALVVGLLLVAILAAICTVNPDGLVYKMFAGLITSAGDSFSKYIPQP